jgi:predicted small lipoprotein YifL
VSHRFTPAPRKILERRRLLALLALGAAGALGACGKKGPLRLPEPPADASDEETE